MPRFRATLSYDGTDFAGFQRQSAVRSVQGEVESALLKIASQPVGVLGAGRTDSGVHASGQVIAFDMEWPHPTEALQRAINANLPADVAMAAVTETRADFHPRYNALSRRYRYQMAVRPQRNPLHDRYCVQVWPPPNAAVLRRLAGTIEGTHDFCGYGSALDSGGSTVRTVIAANWREEETDDGLHLTFEVEANAFLYRMVRRLVGGMLRVAHARWDEAMFETILRGAGATDVSPAAPAHGLTLVAVRYAEDGSEDSG